MNRAEDWGKLRGLQDHVADQPPAVVGNSQAINQHHAEQGARERLNRAISRFIELPCQENLGTASSALVEYQSAWMHGRKRMIGD